MAVIDVGPGATNRATSGNSKLTWICLNNPANASGVLDTFEVWGLNGNLEGVKVGTFSQRDTNKFTSRDYESLGTVTYGSKQTFTGKNCDVVSGDYLGEYHTLYQIERDTSGGGGVYYYAADIFGAGETTCTLLSGNEVSIYATGATGGGGSLPLKNVFSRPFSGVFR